MPSPASSSSKNTCPLSKWQPHYRKHNFENSMKTARVSRLFVFVYYDLMTLFCLKSLALILKMLLGRSMLSQMNIIEVTWKI